MLFYLNNQLSVNQIEFWGKIKGFFYVFITAFLLFVMIRARTKNLFKTKNEMKRLFDENPNPMWVYDPGSLRILMANNAAIQLYKYTREEFMNLTIYDLRPNSEKDKLKDYISDFNEKYSNSGVWIHQDKFSNQFHVNIFSHESIFNDKKCRIVTAIDVQEQVIAQKELKNFARAIDNSAMVILADKHGDFIDANDNYIAMSEFPLDELKEKDNIFFNNGSEDTLNKTLKKLHTGSCWRGDISGISKSGKKYWVDTVITPILDNHLQVEQLMVIGYEISKRKSLEEQQKALLDDLSKYAYLTSHKLRGPIARLLGLTQVMGLNKEDDPILIESIKSTSHELDQVIQSMNESLSRNTFKNFIDRREEEKSL